MLCKKLFTALLCPLPLSLSGCGSVTATSHQRRHVHVGRFRLADQPSSIGTGKRDSVPSSLDANIVAG